MLTAFLILAGWRTAQSEISSVTNAEQVLEHLLSPEEFSWKATNDIIRTSPGEFVDSKRRWSTTTVAAIKSVNDALQAFSMFSKDTQRRAVVEFVQECRSHWPADGLGGGPERERAFAFDCTKLDFIATALDKDFRLVPNRDFGYFRAAGRRKIDLGPDFNPHGAIMGALPALSAWGPESWSEAEKLARQGYYDLAQITSGDK